MHSGPFTDQPGFGSGGNNSRNHHHQHHNLHTTSATNPMPPITSLSSSNHRHPTSTISSSQNNSTSILSTAESILHTRLASALSTISDSQYFEDSISPATIREQLSHDPTQPSSVPHLLKGVKWLLASVSKGRDVSDFFPYAVKLASCPNVELRRMVYVYLVHYADRDDDCRELALLGINAFQRGLSDGEEWIRASALRVLCSMRVGDVLLRIQILAVRRCSIDTSAYVRRCAALAVSKLYRRAKETEVEEKILEAKEAANNNNTNNENKAENNNAEYNDEGGASEELLSILQSIFHNDESTMVLAGAMATFAKACPHRFEMLHVPYRRLCRVLTDMDEWGQVATMDVLAAYCRTYFSRPSSSTDVAVATTMTIVRRGYGGRLNHKNNKVKNEEKENELHRKGIQVRQGLGWRRYDGRHQTIGHDAQGKNSIGNNIATRGKREKWPVGNIPDQTSFYSDDDDNDDNYNTTANNINVEPEQAQQQSMQSGGGRRDIMGLTNNYNAGSMPYRDNISSTNSQWQQHSQQQSQRHHRQQNVIPPTKSSLFNNKSNTNNTDLDLDHALLLQSSTPLLRSRNAAVVLSVCSLHFHCGPLSSSNSATAATSSKALARALVRIGHDRSAEVQYVVLGCVARLVWYCPSAFVSFLRDYFVKVRMNRHVRELKMRWI